MTLRVNIQMKGLWWLNKLSYWWFFFYSFLSTKITNFQIVYLYVFFLFRLEIKRILLVVYFKIKEGIQTKIIDINDGEWFWYIEWIEVSWLFHFYSFSSFFSLSLPFSGLIDVIKMFYVYQISHAFKDYICICYGF